MKKREPLHTVVGNVNEYRYLKKNVEFPQKLRELSYNPAILLPGIYPKEMESREPSLGSRSSGVGAEGWVRDSAESFDGSWTLPFGPL